MRYNLTLSFLPIFTENMCFIKSLNFIINLIVLPFYQKFKKYNESIRVQLKNIVRYYNTIEKNVKN